MTSHIETSTQLRTTLAWWSLTFTLVGLLVAGLALAAPAHAAGVVGNGTPASCTEAALEAALAGLGTILFWGYTWAPCWLLTRQIAGPTR